MLLLIAGACPTVHRVLRGGSFNNNHRNARCAYRNRNNPNNRNNNIGFRVVVRSTLIPSVGLGIRMTCGTPEMRCGLITRTLPPRQKEERRGTSLAESTITVDRANNNSPAPWVDPWCGATRIQVR